MQFTTIWQSRCLYPPCAMERPFGCGALWAPSSTWAVAPSPVQLAKAAPRAGKHSLRLGAPPPARGMPQAVGSQTQPTWQHHLCRRQSSSAGLTPVVLRWVACPCDVEVTSLGPYLPRRARRRALQPPCRGLEHQAPTSPRHARQHRPTVEQAGVPQHRHPPLPQTHKGTYTQARRHLPPASATAGSGGGQQSGRPCDRTPRCSRPVGSRREGGADRGLATM